jgi:hypothetical protein
MRHKGNYKKWVLLCATTIGISSLGVSYAAWSNSNVMIGNVTTKTMDFLFSTEEEFKIKLVNNAAFTRGESASEDLDAIVTSTGKTLTISGMEAVDMSKLVSGEASITIDYSLKAADSKNGLISVADGMYDLGTIPFELSSDKTYWKIWNDNGSWGSGDPELMIPEAAFELLPKSLGDLHGYNSITANKNGVIKGTITIKQLTPSITVIPTIKLTSLKLSDEMNQQIAANELDTSNLEIKANYNFSVPFILDQANIKK